jgi:hypothetical protein
MGGCQLIGYKFLPKQYAEDFAAGNIRISAAHLYRVDDGFDDGRSDTMELITPATIENGAEIINTSHSAFLDFFTVVRGGKQVHLDIEVCGDAVQVIDNAYLFCLTTDFNRSIIKQMNSKFGADAAFQITDLEAFCADLRGIDQLSHMPMSSGLVEYADLPVTNLASMESTDYFRKRPEFTWQSEYRICWIGDVGAEIVNATVPSVASLVSRVL